MNTQRIATLAGLGTALAAGIATAQPVQLQVTVENLAPTNSVTFAPLRVGFHRGIYDAFDQGEAPTAPIISIAEGGSGSEWFPTFQAADPTATLGTVISDPAGPLLPGTSATAVFNIDPSINRYFTFASMVVPSNDYFIGNDSATQYQLLDEQGNLLIDSITQYGRDVWNAGSEVSDISNAAFLVDGDNAGRIAEAGTVEFDFEGLDIFNGLETAAGYTFDRQFGGDNAIYRISFAVVPAPGAMGLLAAGGLVATRRRRN